MEPNSLPEEPGREPIERQELLYRRISVKSDWYNPTTKVVKAQAFTPHKQNDTTGLSIARAKYKTVEEAATGPSSGGYFVAVLMAEDLANHGITIEPRPDVPGGFDASHAELPQLNSAAYKDPVTLELARQLAQLCVRVEGPFLPELE